MKDKKLLFDRSCHVLYSKPCKKEILAKIALHYPETEREAIWERVQLRYAELLADWRTDLGGKKNFHNGVGGTYDCIAIMSYYVVCKAVTSFRINDDIGATAGGYAGSHDIGVGKIAFRHGIEAGLVIGFSSKCLAVGAVVRIRPHGYLEGRTVLVTRGFDQFEFCVQNSGHHIRIGING